MTSWIGVQTNAGVLFCRACTVRMKHAGLHLTDSDVWLAADMCDRCGASILSGEDAPTPDMRLQLIEAGCLRDKPGTVVELTWTEAFFSAVFWLAVGLSGGVALGTWGWIA